MNPAMIICGEKADGIILALSPTRNIMATGLSAVIVKFDAGLTREEAERLARTMIAMQN